MAYIGRSFRRLMNLPGLLHAVVLPYNNSLNRRQRSHGIRQPSRY